MGYEPYAKSLGGYSNDDAGNGYSGNKTPAKQPSPSKGKEGEFTEKKIIEGVGNYHGNHFIAYYYNFMDDHIPSDAEIAKLVKLFSEDFEKIFSSPNVATATLSKYKFKNNKVIDFQLGGTLNKLIEYLPWLLIPYPNLNSLSGLLHTDTVSIVFADNKLSFCGSTLQRNWIEEKELELYTALVQLIGKDKAFDFMSKIVEVNQHHALAGRRSWSIGYDKIINAWYVDTAAFERNSLCEFNVMDKYLDMRETIINLWVNLLNNYAVYYDKDFRMNFNLSSNINYIELQDYLKGYNYKGNVAYKVIEGKTADQLLKTPWFADVLKKHPGLTKGLPSKL